jgi:hypothetical protein
VSVDVESIAAEEARGVAEEVFRLAKLGGTEADYNQVRTRLPFSAWPGNN